MKRRLLPLLLLWWPVSCCLNVTPVPQTVPASDYKLAEQWLSHNVHAKVRNLFVTPHWIGDTDEFWYLRQTPEGHQFMTVDAATGDRRPTFDHVALAEAIHKAGVEKVDAQRLPFRSFEFLSDDEGITFDIGDARYRYGGSPPACVAEKIEPTDGLLVSPDGQSAVRAVAGNLLLRDMKDGDERSLTEDGEEHFGYGIYYGNWKAAFIPRKRAGKAVPPMASEWAPDSRHVLVTRLDERHVKPYPFLETVPDDGSFRPKVHAPRIPLTGEPPPVLDWFVFDVENGSRCRVDLPYDKLFHVHQDMLALRKVWWSSDCSQMFAVAFGDNIESGWFFTVDTSKGKVQTVIEEHMTPRMDLNSTSYNPPNVRVLGDGEEVIWFSQSDGWLGHLYLYDGITGELKNQITRGEWLVRDIVHVDEDRRRIYFTAGGREPGSPYDRYLYRVNLDGSELTLLTPEPADHMVTSPWNDILAIDGARGHAVISPSGNYAVYNYSTIDQPTQTAIRRTEDATLVKVFEQADASELYAAGWQDPEAFVVKAADGKTDLYGVMYKPHDFDPKQTYAVIDSQYASPLTAVVPRNFMMTLYGVPALARPACLAALGLSVCP